MVMVVVVVGLKKNIPFANLISISMGARECMARKK